MQKDLAARFPVPLIRCPPNLRQVDMGEYLRTTAAYRPYVHRHCIVIKNMPELDHASARQRIAFNMAQVNQMVELINSDSIVVDAFRMGSFDPKRPRALKAVFVSSHAVTELVRAFSFREVREDFRRRMGAAYSRVMVRPSFEDPEERSKYERTFWSRPPPRKDEDKRRDSDNFNVNMDIDANAEVNVISDDVDSHNDTIPMLGDQQDPALAESILQVTQSTPKSKNGRSVKRDRPKTPKQITSRNGQTANIVKTPNRFTSDPAIKKSKPSLDGEAAPPQNSQGAATSEVK